jgi:zinc protease
MRRFSTWFASFALLLVTGAPAFSQRPAPIKPLPHTRFVLRNGMTVILNEDRASPLVAFDLYFKVGSRDDPPGRAGLIHFCEHLYGDGTPNLPTPISTFYRTLGGTSPNWAMTTEDITHYFGILPSNQLETILWTEGDRLSKPFVWADSAHVAATRPVVLQERVSRIENPPVIFGAVFELMANALYPAGHPYSTSSTSPVADLPKIAVSDVRETCAPYYVPQNAVLAVSGDFNTATARTWVEKYFGIIPRGAGVKKSAWSSRIIA